MRVNNIIYIDNFHKFYNIFYLQYFLLTSFLFTCFRKTSKIINKKH